MSVKCFLRRYMVVLWVFAAFFVVSGSLCSCSLIGSSAGKEGAADVSSTPASEEAPSITYEFPDLPLPVELKMDNDKSVVIRYPNYRGGIIVLKGRVTVDSLVDFFTKNMPKYGWKFTGSLNAHRILMGFSKQGNAYCLIVVSEGNLGFQTEVQIWLSEPVAE